MDALLEIFPNLKHYLELVPVCIVGIMSGVVAYFGEGDDKRCIKRGIQTIITSGFICVMMYSILSSFDLPYLARVGIASAVGYFGFDKAIDLVQKIFALWDKSKK